MTDRLSILFIDDKPGEVRVSDPGASSLYDAIVVHPRDLQPDHLEGVDLILVDFDLREWDERQFGGSGLAMQPRDGLALAAVVRSYLREINRRDCGVALHSARLEDLSRLPSEILEHVLARNHDLEWVFAKANPVLAVFGELPVANRIADLGFAIRSLPNAWPSSADIIELQAQELLDVSVADSIGEECWGDVVRCHPPLSDLSSDSGGMALVRWLAQRILPYPTFLIDGLHVAAVLKINPPELAQLVEDDSALGEALRKCRYTGILSEFSGPRWWTRGVAALRRELSTDAADDEWSSALAAMAGRSVGYCQLEVPVVCLDDDLRAIPKLLEGAAGYGVATRIRPDDWPIFAESAWVETARLQTSERFAALAAWDSHQTIVRTNAQPSV